MIAATLEAMDSDGDGTITSKDAAGVAHVIARLPHIALTRLWSDREPWRVGESLVLDDVKMT